MPYRVYNLHDLVEIGASNEGRQASFQRALNDLENEGFELVGNFLHRFHQSELGDPWFIFHSK